MTDSVDPTDLFAPPVDGTHTPPTDPLAELVGDGKKFKDANALALAKLEADRFIERLTQEQAALRAELQQRLTLEEFMTKVSSTTARGNEHQAQAPETPAANGLTRDEIVAILRQEDAAKTAQANALYVRQELEKAWGRDFSTVLRAKAQELGVSEASILEDAKTKPKLLLSALGVGNQVSPQRAAAPPSSSYNPNNGSQPSQNKDHAYYSKLRKENPSLYFSPKIQIEMDREAQRQGASFFNK